MAVSQEQYDRALARLRKLRAEGQAALSTAVNILEVQGSSGVQGFVDGYFGKPDAHGHVAVHVLGVPLAFWIGPSFHLLGAFGLASEHMHALGNGVMAAEVGRMGFEHGQKQASTTGGASAGSRIPLAMSAGRTQYSDDVLRNIARTAG
jgi:hypothetical protein